MARHRFGGVADYVVSLGTGNAAVLQPAVTVTCWNMAVGGTQYTDLTQTDGTTPISGGNLTADSTGALPEFMGPDGVTELYLDANAGAGPRRRTVATDLGSDITSVRTDLDAHTGAVNPHGTRYSDLSGLYVPRVSDLLAANPFYIAHRGSGDEYPEHTMAAYEAALNAGAKAIEVSARLTADGQLVCFHDGTIDRMTDFTGDILDYTYAALKQKIKVKAQGLLGPGWADQDIPLLRDVLDRLYGKCVIFVEPKSSEAVVPLQNLLLERYPDAPRSIVWKNYYLSTALQWGRDNGFTNWVYVDATTTSAQMDAVDSNVDIWGVPHSMTDANISAVVARGKPVIVWEVHRRSEATRFTGLGVQGLMCSGYQYVTRSTPVLKTDDWALQVKAPGNLGLANYDEAYALKYGSDPGGDVYINRVTNESVLLGSFCPTAGSGYTIAFDMMFETLPTASQHAGIAFGKPDDTKYQFSIANASGGYHIAIRGNGDLQIYRHDPGVATGVKLAEVLVIDQPAGAAPVSGQWMSFTVQVTATQITLTRTDLTPDVVLTATDSTYRGGYMHLSQGSVNNLANKPHWRNFSVT